MSKHVNGTSVPKDPVRSLHKINAPDSDPLPECQQHVAFNAITTVSIAVRLSLFAWRTNSQFPNGARELLRDHAHSGDLTCQLLLRDVKAISGKASDVKA
jgi:hypothetical protein